MVNRYAFRVLNAFQKSDFLPIAVRRAVLRIMGVRITGKPIIMSGVDFLQGDITLGDAAFVNYRCLIEGRCGVAIGRRAHLAQGVMLLTESHAIGPSHCRAGPVEAAPVKIGEGAWVGAGTIVLPGTSIGPGAVIGAQSMARGAIAADAVHAGTPASLRRALPRGNHH